MRTINVKAIFDRYKVRMLNDTIFDTIRKKYVHLTPEEIVRQKAIKYLIKRLEVPADRIIVERSLNSLGVNGNKKRIDIGVLDDNGLLMAVVECKAFLPHNDETAFIQAQDYLFELNARYFFVTDGYTFGGYYYDKFQFIRLEEIPTFEKWHYCPYP